MFYESGFKRITTISKSEIRRDEHEGFAGQISTECIQLFPLLGDLSF